MQENEEMTVERSFLVSEELSLGARCLELPAGLQLSINRQNDLNSDT
jgi:hypothetical protein